MFLNASHYTKEQAFSKSFCDNIIKLGQRNKLEKAKITSGNQSNRNSKVSFIKNKDIETKITRVINQVNEQSNWNFLLREFEPLQYTVYNKGDYYDWHIDSRLKPYNNGLIRKLSFTICLNDDYEGGLFELCSPHPINQKNTITSYFLKQGSIIVFPSHMWHKIHEVTSGVRKALVGWILGKPFV
jgi:PKHD-type hydroxylase